MNKINILHITTALVVGGAEKVMIDLIENLDKDTFNCSVLGLAKYDDMLAEFRSYGIQTDILGIEKGIGGFITAFRKLNQYVIDNNIDIIHAHLFHPLPLAVLLKIRHPSLKIVFTSHNTDIGGKIRDIITYLVKPFRSKDVIFSDDMMHPIYKKGDTHVIANGVNIKKFQDTATKNTPFTFLNIGTVRAQKNQIFLVECARKLKDKGHEFVIDIAGGGAENQKLIDTIQQAIIDQDVSDCLRMLGARSDIPELLKTAHCMVLPSHFEGLPIVLLEAGAAKLPVISTPVGAIPTVLNESNGYLATLDTFCDTMEHVLTHYDEAQQRAAALAQTIDEGYSITNMARQHAELYQSVIK